MTTQERNMNNKQVSINLISNIVSYSANIIISFVLTPFLINTIGKEVYSFYPIANSIVSYMSILTTAMNSMASRFVTINLVKENSNEVQKYYSSAFASNFVLGIALSIPLFLIVIFLDVFMKVPINSLAAVRLLFTLVFSSAILNIITSVFGIATFAKNRIDLRSLRELVTAVLRLLLFFIFYKFFIPSIVYVGVVTLIVAIINIIFQKYYTLKLLPDLKIKKKNITFKHTKILFVSSSWNAINSFGNIMLTGVSMVLANMFYGASASGSYAIVNTVPQFINGVIVMLVGVFYPVITYKFASGNRKELLKEIKKAQKIVGTIGCVVIAVFLALSQEFFSLWTPDENSKYLSILTLSTIVPHFLISCTWSLTNLNIVMNKVKIPAVFTLFCGVANILLAFLAYKIFNVGLISLPLISSVLQIIWIGVFMPIYVSLNLKVRLSTFYPPILRGVFCSIIIVIFISIFKNMFNINSWISLFTFGSISGVLSLVFMLCVMLGPKTIVDQIKKLE